MNEHEVKIARERVYRASLRAQRKTSRMQYVRGAGYEYAPGRYAMPLDYALARFVECGGKL